MTLYTGTVDTSGGLAATAMVYAIRDHLVAEGWTFLEEQSSSGNPVIFMMGPGLSGLEEIYFSMRSLSVTGGSAVQFNSMSSYVPGSTYVNQPGFLSSTANYVNLISASDDYYLIANGQRFVLGTSNLAMSQNIAYVGKFFPYADPGEYGYPVVYKGTSGNTSPGSFHVHTGGVFFDPGPIPASVSYFYPAQTLMLSTSNVGIGTSGAPSIDIDGDITLFPAQFVKYTGQRGRYYPVGQYDGVFAIGNYNVSPLTVIQEGGSSVVDQTGLSVVDAVTAIEAVGGVAYIVFRSGNSASANSFLAIEVS